MSIRPNALKDIVGQDHIKQMITMQVKSANFRNAALPHSMFSGPPGYGKTTFARAIAQELGVNLYCLNAANVKSAADLREIVNIKHREILFIDEVHNLSNKVTDSLLTILEDFEYLDGYRRVQLAEFTIIAATTRKGQLDKPFKDRFKYDFEFKKYTLDQLIKIVHSVAGQYKFALSDKAAEIIAKTCRNTPRLVVNRTELIRDYMIANDIKNLSSNTILNIFSLQGIDAEGLTGIDREYLKALKSGVRSLDWLAKYLNTDRQTILEDVEPYLIELGKINITKKGRELVDSENDFSLGALFI